MSSPATGTPGTPAVLNRSATSPATSGQMVASTSGTSGSTLPFSGFEVSIALLLGVAALGTGLFVRRLAAKQR
jgi:hypothetical protein